MLGYLGVRGLGLGLLLTLDFSVTDVGLFNRLFGALGNYCLTVVHMVLPLPPVAARQHKVSYHHMGVQ